MAIQIIELNPFLCWFSLCNEYIKLLLHYLTTTKIKNLLAAWIFDNTYIMNVIDITTATTLVIFS